MEAKLKAAIRAAATTAVICLFLVVSGCSDIAVPCRVGPITWAVMGAVSMGGLMWFIKNDC